MVAPMSERRKQRAQALEAWADRVRSEDLVEADTSALGRHGPGTSAERHGSGRFGGVVAGACEGAGLDVADAEGCAGLTP